MGHLIKFQRLFIALFLVFLAVRASAQTNVYLYSGAETNITLGPGYYNITAYGAQGGQSTYDPGSLGAEMEGQFNFATAVNLVLLVGGSGYTGYYAGGGGGGSFVVNGTTPLVIAGGGSGAGIGAGGNGLTGTSGGSSSGQGGSNGLGGGGGGPASGLPGYYGGGGGGGYTGNGTNAVSGGAGGNSFLNGGAGGSGGITGYTQSQGGYGGGGGGDAGAGGGGGYSGGGGSGGLQGGGGGGGSYIDSSAIQDLTEISGVASPDGSPNGEIIIIEINPYDLIIQAQPSSQTVAGGQTATFSVATTFNTPPLGYQWMFNGTNISGATNATYIISDVQSNNYGDYSVVLSDAVTNVTSSNALLTVIYPPPVIVMDPVSLLAGVGSNATFSASATSYYPMNFQWQFNGTNLVDGGQISGSTNSTLTIFSAGDANVGSYQFITSNSYGAVTSLVASLTVYDPSAQTTYYVDINSHNPTPPYSTWSTAATNIQSAINQSANGDTVLVAPGIYFEADNFDGKAIVLRSLNGPSQTWINATNSIGITFGSGETTNSVLSGFTLTNAATGISLSSSSATIVSNIIVNCPIGINGSLASPIITGNFINGGNNAGIAILANSAPVLVQDNVVQNHNGGIGVGGNGYQALVTGNLIQNNAGDGVGSVSGGMIVQNVIINNSGNGITVGGSTFDTGATIINNTISGNGGSGIGLARNPSPSQIINNIIVGNPALNYSTSVPTVELNDLFSTNIAVIQSGIATNLNGMNGNIYSNPLFVSAANRNFHLLAASPCIDMGTNGPPFLLPVDFGGSPRIIAGKTNDSPIIDMGAYEFQLPGFIQAPVILAEPTNVSASINASCSIPIYVSATPPVYLQWQKNGINLVDDGRITGSGTATLAFSKAEYTDSGQYDLIISNASGEVISSNCPLAVVPIVLWGYHAQTPPAAATNILSISAGADYHQNFDMALRADGTVVQWGLGVPVPPEATNVVAIAAGYYFGLALRQDGTVVQWDDDPAGYVLPPPPPGLTNVTSIAAGWYHCLALLQNGTIVGWGDDSSGESTPPDNATNVIAIAAGDGYSEAVRQDGSVIAWGGGLGSFGALSPPNSATDVVAITAAQTDVVALRQDRTMTGWGENTWGQDTPPPGITNVAEIANNYEESLVLFQNGTVTDWGKNVYQIPANVINVVSVSATGYHYMALVNDPYTQAQPVLVQNPMSDSPLIGQTAILLSQAIGSFPLQYQWYFNGAPLNGQTNNWLALMSLVPSQVGNYQVVITNNFGAVTSQVATVTEQPWATISTGPANTSAVVSSNATFTVSMYGASPFYYQWYFNGVPLTNSENFGGANASTLTVSNVQIFDGGDYSVIISNAYNSATSDVATLTVLVPAGITTQPTNQSVLLNGTAVFTAVATGTGSLNYQWMASGTNLYDGNGISGSGTPTLTISGAQTNEDGSYQVLVSNDYGMVTSVVATLTVYDPANILTQPSSEAILLGGTASFSTTVAGTALTYQWFNNGIPLSDNGRISGSGTSVLTINSVQTNDVGGYYLVASNIFSVASSLTASLTPLTVQLPSVRYVSLSNTNPLPPYLTWNTAATNIQDAIDATIGGDSIMVTDGVYQAGGRVIYGSLTNRVAINKAITVQSVNGAAVTIIQGNNALGSNAVRCVYLTNNAVLSGFTLTQGATRTNGLMIQEQSGGGAWCESTNAQLIGCLIISNTAWLYGGGEYSGTLNNGVVSNNIAGTAGGGVYTNLLNNSILTGNSVTNSGSGGGAYLCTLNNCIVSNNISSSSGGGMIYSVANNCLICSNVCLSTGAGGGAAASVLGNCLIIGNKSGSSGGGAWSSTLNSCQVTGNIASGGGGASSSTLNNSLLYGNYSSSFGGGVLSCTLRNCTVTANSAGSGAAGTVGGTDGGVAVNSIVFLNIGRNNFSTFLTNSCSIPLPSFPYLGPGNFTNAPLFVNGTNDFHLQFNSPCINSGTNRYVIATTDLDGNPRIVGGLVDIGAYEYQSPVSVVPNHWLEQYGLTITNNIDTSSPNGTGFTVYQDWIAGLNPTNPASVLVMLPVTTTNTSAGIKVTWQSTSGIKYILQSTTNLPIPFSTIKTNIIGNAGTTSYTDTSATNGTMYFYRVGVQAP
jgi:hypothetical protein